MQALIERILRLDQFSDVNTPYSIFESGSNSSYQLKQNLLSPDIAEEKK